MTSNRTTRVVNLYKEDFDVYIGRRNPRFKDDTKDGSDGYFGNPFNLKTPATEQERESCLKSYREYFIAGINQDAKFRKRIRHLQGKTLGCFCKPQLCHGDIIKEYLDTLCSHYQPSQAFGGYCMICDTGMST